MKSFNEHSKEKLGMSDVRTRFLILSGEGSSDTENQFVMELNTEDEAIEHFKEFKEGTFKNTELMIYKAVLILDRCTTRTTERRGGILVFSSRYK